MSQTIILLEESIGPDQAGTYFTIPFYMYPDAEKVTIKYDYARHDQQWLDYGRHGLEEDEAGDLTAGDLSAGEFSTGGPASGTFTARPEINIIDLGLIGPDGEQVGASGSDKREIFVSELRATPGYKPRLLTEGTWKILVGAYKIAPEGVSVGYQVTIDHKEPRTLKGDLHTHTLASDGILTVSELAQRALRHGLDFLAITDHNQPVSPEALPQIDGMTLIPGLEWTHYQGHANFLGVARPFDGTFAANTPAEMEAIFATAKARGATIVLNHPCDEGCPFLLDLERIPFDCIEIWNGPMRIPNLQAVALWQKMLAAGKKIPACGGSDYHRDTPFIFPGGPTTCITAMSNAPSDILAALRAGHAYITYAPNGPELEFSAGEAIFGDTVSWAEVKRADIRASGLQAGDVLRVITAAGVETLCQATAPGEYEGHFEMPGPGFARVEVLRSFIPGLPQLPALISNPIYFDEET